MIAQAQFTIADLSDATAEVIVGTQTAATNAWTGKASFEELKDGQTILYWLPFAGTSTAATLNLTLSNGTTTGAKNVYINGTSRCTTHVAVGNITQMTYRVNTPINGSGSYTGWWISRNQDTTTNYYDRINYKASVTATGAIAAGRLGVFNSAGKLILLSTTAFDVTKPILYVGTAYTASALTQTNNYIAWGTAFSLASTVSGFSGTAGKTVYIKGTLNGSMFTPAAGVLTTTVPTTEDGYTYILLGLMSTTVNAVLAPEHPMFRYYNGGFKTIPQIAYEAYVAAEEAQEEIDRLEVGGRNYILQSNAQAESDGYLIWTYEVSSPLEAGEEYTVSMCVSPASGVTAYGVWLSTGYAKQCELPVSGAERQIVSQTFTAFYYANKTPEDDAYNNTTHRIVFEGSYLGAASFAAWEDSSGSDRRMLEVRTKDYESNIDNAVLLRCAESGTWYTYRLFHSGMASPVPIANGGTGANNAVTARYYLGANDASNLNAGTIPAARLPFKVAYGSVSVNSSTSAYIDYSSAGFTSVPYVLINYSTTSANWTGTAGAIKVHTKTISGAYATVGGSYGTLRECDWIAIGV